MSEDLLVGLEEFKIKHGDIPKLDKMFKDHGEAVITVSKHKTGKPKFIVKVEGQDDKKISAERNKIILEYLKNKASSRKVSSKKSSSRKGSSKKSIEDLCKEAEERGDGITVKIDGENVVKTFGDTWTIKTKDGGDQQRKVGCDKSGNLKEFYQRAVLKKGEPTGEFRWQPITKKGRNKPLPDPIRPPKKRKIENVEDLRKNAEFIETRILRTRAKVMKLKGFYHKDQKAKSYGKGVALFDEAKKTLRKLNTNITKWDKDEDNTDIKRKVANNWKKLIRETEKAMRKYNELDKKFNSDSEVKYRKNKKKK